MWMTKGNTDLARRQLRGIAVDRDHEPDGASEGIAWSNELMELFDEVSGRR